VLDPDGTDDGRQNMAAVQVMGPGDGYLVQADRDDTKFWAWEDAQALGCTFRWKDGQEEDEEEGSTLTAMGVEDWKNRVESGFQMLPTRLLGRVVGHDGSLGGVHDGQGIPGSCDFDLTIQPLSGWGDDDDDEHDTKAITPRQPNNNKNTHRRRKARFGQYGTQKSTAGWLASYAVFEPHWQVTMADGLATGSATWKGKEYNFEDVPFYAEKNWGGAFPSKWYWVQCNSFDGYERLSVTAGKCICWEIRQMC